MIDYLIVGGGLAGVSFASLLEGRRKSFKLVDNEQQNTPSYISFGLYHPFLLKRSKTCWRGLESMELIPSFFQNIDALIQATSIDFNEIRYIFPQSSAHNDWVMLKDRPLEGKFIDPQIYTSKINHLHTPFGWSKILNSGRVNIKNLCHTFKTYLKKTDQLLSEHFDHNALSIQEHSIEYKGIQAKHLIFAEGYGMSQNPFFNYLPLMGNKAEVLTLDIPSLNLQNPLRAKGFLVPLGNNLYGAGTTYDRKDKDTTPTQQGRETILKQLKMTLTTSHQIIHHQAAIRPTTKDRKPLAGVHPKHKPLAVLNGLGGRGILNIPYTATALFNFLEHNHPVPKDICIERFSR